MGSWTTGVPPFWQNCCPPARHLNRDTAAALKARKSLLLQSGMCLFRKTAFVSNHLVKLSLFFFLIIIIFLKTKMLLVFVLKRKQTVSSSCHSKRWMQTCSWRDLPQPGPVHHHHPRPPVCCPEGPTAAYSTATGICSWTKLTRTYSCFNKMNQNVMRIEYQFCWPMNAFIIKG